MATLAVRREALYLGEQDRRLFACFHVADHAAALDCVAVICNPIGYEYIHSHRTLRHLADDLARAGLPALRFDYDGTGDSPGTDLDPDRLSRWVEDIETAIAAARSLSGCTRVCLVGLRLGATLAMLAVSHAPVDGLVLWSPCVSGRRYVREMQALAQAARTSVNALPGKAEAAGFLMSAQTQQQLNEIRLLDQSAQVAGRALVLARDDMSVDHLLPDHLRSLGVETDTRTVCGYADMMAEPQHSVVPQAALDEIVRWVVRQARPHTPPARLALGSASEIRFNFTGIDGANTCLTETACRFGDDGHLVGIHCQPQGIRRTPTIVLFNSGVVHRVGPNRLYVELARNFAAIGFASFRCDLEGIGDSVLRGPGRENHPYPDTAGRDARSALHFLVERFGAQEFVLMGLCSGAYTSFNMGLSDGSAPISELVLINPLTFHWKEGDSLDTQHFRTVAHYKGTIRRLDSWKKLLRGEVNIVHLGTVLLTYLRTQFGSYLNTLAERWLPSAGPLLSRQLTQLFERGRKVSMFIASGDPGYDMLAAEARHTARKALVRGDLAVQFIDEADHTFSGEDARLRLVTATRDHLLQRYDRR